MLNLISLGLWNEKSMSVEALDAAKFCDVLYMEDYTSKLFGSSKEKLEEILGKEIKMLAREDVEQSGILLEEAKEKEVGFLTSGDVLTATTHVDLLIEAKKQGIETRVIHGTSIFVAAPGLAGLQIYKFGKSTSIPYQEEGYEVESFYDVLKENKSIGAHTLVFLDIKPPRYMTANEGIEILLKVEEKRKEKIFTEETGVVVIARAGSEKAMVRFGKAKDLLKEDFGEPLHVLIVPGKLHFKEEEALESLK